jgi:hypothetical protein
MYIIYLTEVVLDATCLDGEPATQCADGLAECRDQSGFKCLCKAANYKTQFLWSELGGITFINVILR